MSKNVRRILTVAVLVAMVGLAVASTSLTSIQNIHVTRTVTCMVLSYNYSTNSLSWSSELYSSGNAAYTKPADSQWLGLWVYDTASGLYTDVYYLYEDVL